MRGPYGDCLLLRCCCTGPKNAIGARAVRKTRTKLASNLLSSCGRKLDHVSTQASPPEGFPHQNETFIYMDRIIENGFKKKHPTLEYPRGIYIW